MNKCFDTQKQAASAKQQDEHCQRNEPGTSVPVLGFVAKIVRSFTLASVYA